MARYKKVLAQATTVSTDCSVRCSRLADQRLNILLIVGEDTGRFLGCYGDPVARTPHLDRLAEGGCRFDQAFTTYPVCSAARSSLVTGQYPMKLGNHQHRSKLTRPPRLFTHNLREAGYFVNWFGKLDFNFEPDAAWRDADAEWLDDLAAGRLPDQPWMVYRNLGITHESNIWPDKRFADGRRRPDAVTDPDLVPVPPYLPDIPIVRADLARHYDNVAALDAEVGRVLEALEASGQADRTIVLFLSDHGRGLPREKRWCYTGGLHMPLIVRAPGLIEGGTVDDRLVCWVDIGPTLLSLVGLSPRSEMDGQAAFGPEAASAREWVFAGRDRMDEQFDRVRVCRNHRHHYVRNFYPQLPWSQRNGYAERSPTLAAMRRLNASGELRGDGAVFMPPRKPAEELFDLTTDPHCIRNVAGDSRYADALAAASSALTAFLDRVDDKGAIAERELIARGVVEDSLAKLRPNVKPLPPEYRVGIDCGVLEMHEAEALAAEPSAQRSGPANTP